LNKKSQTLMIPISYKYKENFVILQAIGIKHDDIDTMTLILIACRNVMHILLTNFIFRYALLAGVDVVIVEIKHESKLKYKLKCTSLVLFNFSTHFQFFFFRVA